MVYWRREGLFYTLAGSTSILKASLFPVSLNIEKPIIGHPLDVGSFQPIWIDVLVVDNLVGTLTFEGFKQA